MRIVDNFLDDDLYQWFLRNLNDFDYYTVDKTKDLYLKQEHDCAEDVVLKVKKCYEDKVGRALGHFNVGVVKCDPNYKYPWHADHHTKLMSSVLYLHPNKSSPTIFQDERTLEWKPNRLVLWVNKGQIHRYTNSTDEPRYTLNIYQTSGDPKRTPFAVSRSQRKKSHEI